MLLLLFISFQVTIKINIQLQERCKTVRMSPAHGESGGGGFTDTHRGLVGGGTRFLGPVDWDMRPTQHGILGGLHPVGVERYYVISAGPWGVGVIRCVAPACEFDTHGVVRLRAGSVREGVRIRRWSMR